MKTCGDRENKSFSDCVDILVYSYSENKCVWVECVNKC